MSEKLSRITKLLRPMTSHLTKRQFILQVWRKIGADLVGGIELQRINEELVKKFGPGGAESPAALARVLADEGARLKHPEVLETDTIWREQQLYSLFAPGEIDFNNLAASLESIAKLDALYRQFLAEGDDPDLVVGAQPIFGDHPSRLRRVSRSRGRSAPRKTAEADDQNGRQHRQPSHLA